MPRAQPQLQSRIFKPLGFILVWVLLSALIYWQVGKRNADYLTAVPQSPPMLWVNQQSSYYWHYNFPPQLRLGPNGDVFTGFGENYWCFGPDAKQRWGNYGRSIGYSLPGTPNLSQTGAPTILALHGDATQLLLLQNLGLASIPLRDPAELKQAGQPGRNWELNWPEAFQTFLTAGNAGYVVCVKQQVSFVDPKGKVRWSRKFAHQASAAAVIDNKGQIYLPREDLQQRSYSLLCLKPTGGTAWTISLTAQVAGILLLDDDRLILSSRTEVTCRSTDGRQRWQHRPGMTIGAMCAGADNSVLFQVDEWVACLDGDGNKLWAGNYLSPNSANVKWGPLAFVDPYVYVAVEETLNARLGVGQRATNFLLRLARRQPRQSPTPLPRHRLLRINAATGELESAHQTGYHLAGAILADPERQRVYTFDGSALCAFSTD